MKNSKGEVIYMKKFFLIASLVTLTLIATFFLINLKEPTEIQMKVAILGEPNDKQSDIFIYDPISLADLESETFTETDYRNAEALFIYPEYFYQVSQESYRKYLKEIAHSIPVVFVDAGNFMSRSLFDTELSYEEIVKDSGFNEHTQAIYYFANGDDAIFRTDGDGLENQQALVKAIKLMHSTNSYAEWQRQLTLN